MSTFDEFLEHGEMITTIQTIATSVIALAGVYIAWQQKRLADARLQNDLFDRRYSIFMAIQKFMEDVSRDPVNADKYIIEYNVATFSAPFFFDEEVCRYMKYIKELAADYNEDRQYTDTHSERSARGRFRYEYHKMAERFKPVMGLDRGSWAPPLALSTRK